MAYVSFRTAGSIWLRQRFMDAIPVGQDILVPIHDGLFPFRALPQLSLYFLYKSRLVVGSQCVIEYAARTFPCDFAKVLAGMISIHDMGTLGDVVSPCFNPLSGISFDDNFRRLLRSIDLLDILIYFGP